MVVDLDEIRIKVSAPKRVQQPHIHRHITRSPSQVAENDEELSPVAVELLETNAGIEQSWETQLRERLLELDPVTGEAIFDSYKQEKDSYALKLEALVKDHQESEDLDYLIDELDFTHQQKLQDIFGPYFEDLRDLQGALAQ